MVSEQTLRALVDKRVVVIIDHPLLHEESAGQQNWGVVQTFDDETFVVKIEEGVYDFWVFHNDVLMHVQDIDSGSQIRITHDGPGRFTAAAIRGDNPGAHIEGARRQLRRQRGPEL